MSIKDEWEQQTAPAHRAEVIETLLDAIKGLRADADAYRHNATTCGADFHALACRAERSASAHELAARLLVALATEPEKS